MRKQHQTVFGVPHGNCFATCVACLFDLDVSEVPNFCGPEHGEKWWDAFAKWCLPRGISPVPMKTDTMDVFFVHRLQLSIVSGPAGRGHMHSVIYRGSRMVWDPHPDGTGLDSIVDVVLFPVFDPLMVAGNRREKRTAGPPPRYDDVYWEGTRLLSEPES